MGKVAKSAPSIMAALYGSRQRPETAEYMNRCADQQMATGSYEPVVKTEKPRRPRCDESPRTKSKWAKARARLTAGV